MHFCEKHTYQEQEPFQVAKRKQIGPRQAPQRQAALDHTQVLQRLPVTRSEARYSAHGINGQVRDDEVACLGCNGQGLAGMGRPLVAGGEVATD